MKITLIKLAQMYRTTETDLYKRLQYANVCVTESNYGLKMVDYHDACRAQSVTFPGPVSRFFSFILNQF